MTPQERADYIEPKIAAALALLDTAVKQYKPKMVVGLMSGGDDSIPACYVASLHPAFSGILHVNTGIGIEATREHVRKVCAERKWKLWEYKALENVNARGESDPQSYEEYVLKHGQSDFLADAESIPVEMQHLCHSCNKQGDAPKMTA